MDETRRLAETPVGSDPTKSGNALMDALSGKLLESAGMISSEDTQIERAIGKAMEGLKSGNESSKKRIESEYQREVGYAEDAIATDITQSREAGRGFALNIGALREITKTGDKKLNDLWQRKEELILTGDAETAKAVSNLALQELQFQQEARQRTFTNLLGMANFASARATEDRLSRAQSFGEKQAISSIALTYGLKLNENDTIDTITARAMPFASEKQRLEISKMKADINKANAEATKALRGDSSAQIDVNTASILATAFRKGNTDFLATIKDLDSAGKIYDQVEKQAEADKAAAKEKALQIYEKNGSSSQFLKALKEDPNIIVDDATAAAIAKEVFVKKTKEKSQASGKRTSLFENRSGTSLLGSFGNLQDPFAGLFGN